MKIIAGILIILTGYVLASFERKSHVAEAQAYTTSLQQQRPVYWQPFIGSILVITGILVVVKGRHTISLNTKKNNHGT